MVSSSQIRSRLAMFLCGNIDLDLFEDWLVQNTWNIHLSGSTAAEALTFAIEELLSDFSSRRLDEKSLRFELSQVLRAETKSVEIADAPQIVWSFRSSAPVTSLLVLAR